MRIIAGEFRSRRLLTPRDDSVTRPIPDRVRESLFGLLRGHCENANVFDGFAGTGAFGLEAASRGAAHCLMVEQDREISRLLQQNVESLGCQDRCEVVQGDALGAGALARSPRPLTLAFLDPPYPLVRDPIGLRRVLAQLRNLIELLTPDGFAVLRTPWPLRFEVPNSVAMPAAPEPQVRPPSRKDKRSRVKQDRAWRRHGEKMGSPARGIAPDSDGEPDLQSDELAENDDAGQEAAMTKSAQTPAVKPTYVDADLTIEGAVGPETHAYHTMAVHLYAKKPAS